jgi:hypothetical protein
VVYGPGITKEIKSGETVICNECYIYKYTKIESYHKETMHKLLSNELTDAQYRTG